MSNAQSFKERHQPSFLKAFSRFGKVAPAARSSRISRDVVYDWLRSDEDFRRSYADARLVSKKIQPTDFREHVWVFFSIVQDYIPLKSHPAVLAELNIELSKLEFKKGQRSTASPLSRTKERFPSSLQHRMATVVDGGDRDLHQGKNGTFT